MNFESNLQDLQEIVAQLESGKLSFEDGLKAFEKGIELFRKCSKTLEEGQKKIEILTAVHKDENGVESIATKNIS